MTGFSDPILTGDGSLIRKAAKSPNYLMATTGWSINQDGSAEFNNVTARGTVEVDGTGGTYVQIYNDPTNGAIIAMEPATTPAAVTPGQLITQWANPGSGPRPHIVINAPDYNGHGHANLDLSGTIAAGTGGTQATLTSDNTFIVGNQNVSIQISAAPVSLAMGVTGINLSGDTQANGNLSVTGDLSVSGVGNTLLARKSANQSIVSNATLFNDASLVVAVAANATYEMTAILRYEAGTVGDIQTQWLGPSGASVVGSVAALISTAASDTDDYIVGYQLSEVHAAGGRGAGNPRAMQFVGMLTTGSTAGNLQLQWAQLAPDTVATILYANSYLLLRRVA